MRAKTLNFPWRYLKLKKKKAFLMHMEKVFPFYLLNCNAYLMQSYFICKCSECITVFSTIDYTVVCCGENLFLPNFKALVFRSGKHAYPKALKFLKSKVIMNWLKLIRYANEVLLITKTLKLVMHTLYRSCFHINVFQNP